MVNILTMNDFLWRADYNKIDEWNGLDWSGLVKCELISYM